MSSKSSVEAGKHPYQKLSLWTSGYLAFWRKPRPGSIEGYNVPEYEKRLSEEVKHHRKFIKL